MQNETFYFSGMLLCLLSLATAFKKSECKI